MAGVLNLTERAAPGTPASGTHNLYVATADSAWHILDDAAANKTLATTDDQLTIADAAITNAKLANMAEATVKGRAAGAGTGAPTDLTSAQLADIISDGLTLPAGDAAWTDATLEAGYVITGTVYPYLLITDKGPCGYRKVAGVVHLRGMAKCNSGTLMFTLAAGYRPEYDAMYPIFMFASSSAIATYVWVYTTGEVHTVGSAGYWYYLDSVHFAPAGA
jgi:hypothetical protein